MFLASGAPIRMLIRTPQGVEYRFACYSCPRVFFISPFLPSSRSLLISLSFSLFFSYIKPLTNQDVYFESSLLVLGGKEVTYFFSFFLSYKFLFDVIKNDFVLWLFLL